MHLRYRAWDTFWHELPRRPRKWLLTCTLRKQSSEGQAFCKARKTFERSWTARVWRKCPLHSGSNFFFFPTTLGKHWSFGTRRCLTKSLPYSRLAPILIAVLALMFCVMSTSLTEEIVLTETDLDLIWQLTFETIPKVPRRHLFTVNVQMSNIFPQAHQDFDNPPKQKRLTNYTDLKPPTYSLVHQHILIPTDCRVCQTPNSLMVRSSIFLIWVKVFWLQMNLLWLIQEYSS